MRELLCQFRRFCRDLAAGNRDVYFVLFVVYLAVRSHAVAQQKCLPSGDTATLAAAFITNCVLILGTMRSESSARRMTYAIALPVQLLFFSFLNQWHDFSLHHSSHPRPAPCGFDGFASWARESIVLGALLTVSNVAEMLSQDSAKRG
jgi:hypothetical protein